MFAFVRLDLEAGLSSCVLVFVRLGLEAGLWSVLRMLPEGKLSDPSRDGPFCSEAELWVGESTIFVRIFPVVVVVGERASASELMGGVYPVLEDLGFLVPEDFDFWLLECLGPLPFDELCCCVDLYCLSPNCGDPLDRAGCTGIP